MCDHKKNVHHHSTATCLCQKLFHTLEMFILCKPDNNSALILFDTIFRENIEIQKLYNMFKITQQVNNEVQI